ncbi:C2H2-type zinc finger protein [Methanococcoides sp. LMO-2]|uniref:C2H2-type zinc finger protein n=1 Tax=Methanococcoides cohabitans TaxID=3136559 RepID=A0ABU9KWM1_9EURY
MLKCRSCGKTVGFNGFCSDCMTSAYVIEVKDEGELDFIKPKSSSTVKAPLPTVHGEDEGKHIIYTDKNAAPLKTLSRRHFDSHNYGKYKTGSYKCRYCGQNFKSEINLNQHVKNIHSYKCKFCGNFFQTKNILEMHIERTHTCKYCGEKFQSKNILKQHVKNVHNNIQTKKIQNTKLTNAIIPESRPSLKKLWNEIQIRESNPNTDVSFFRKYDGQKVTILVEYQIFVNDVEYFKLNNFTCEIIEHNSDYELRVQKWVQGRIKVGTDEESKFYPKRHTSSFNPIT